jgi:hypothetical protein
MIYLPLRSSVAMRVMFVPESIQLIDSVEFAKGLHQSRLRRVNHARIKQGGLYAPRKAALHLVAYMAWPNDEAKRDQWKAAVETAGLLAGADAAEAREHFDIVDLKLLAEPALEAKTAEIAAMQSAWGAVADIFGRLVDMAADEGLNLRRGASISKAIDLCQKDKNYARSQLEKFWSQYRDVAHLITAAAFLASLEETGDGSIFAAVWLSPDAVIGIADGFELFGLAAKPHGATDTFLSSATACDLIPVDFSQSI